MNDGAKVCFLFNNVTHQGLQRSIDTLKAQQTTGTNITYTIAANHLATAVSELPEYIAKNCNVSSVNATNAEKSSIYDADSSIITSHIPDWKSLSKADKFKVIAERKRLGIKKKGKFSKTNKDESATVNTTKQLKEQQKKFKIQIKSLKRSASEAKNNGDSSDEDASDRFRGKAVKKKNKKNGS